MERRLGRGLEALLGKGGVAAATSQSTQTIPIDRVRTNPHQPRRNFDNQALLELKNSIERDGLLQPIVVRRVDDGYELIAGERRWRACRDLEMTRIAALVREANEDQRLVLALVENLQRSDLDPIEESRAYRQLLDEFGLTHDAIAERVGKERSTVTNSLRLLDLPEEVLGEVSRGTLTAGHARALIPIVSKSSFAKVFQRVLKERPSVRELERWVREKGGAGASGRRKGGRPRGEARDPAVVDLEDRIRARWGTLVRVVVARRGGEVSFRCSSRAELDDLLVRLETATWTSARNGTGQVKSAEFTV